jgi:hypothetical protein
VTATETNREPLDTTTVLADLTEFWANPEPGILGRIPSRKIAGSDWDQQVPEGTENPYWEIVRQIPLEDGLSFGPSRPEPSSFVVTGQPPVARALVNRNALCGTFSWSIPSPGDMTWMRQILGGRGVVEAGAGSGYWAWQMRQAGIDAVAYEPADPADNKYVHREWTALLRDGHQAPQHHPDRALFLCWPSYDEPWAAHALSCYSGDLLIYCGEGWGGCCADDGFFKLIDAEWEEIGSSPAHVSFWGIHCYLTAYRRKETEEQL